MDKGERIPKTIERILKNNVNNLLHLLRGELGGFKAEIYNHLHALENRLDALEKREADLSENTALMGRKLEDLNVKVESLERDMEKVYSKLRHIDSAILFLIILNVLTVILLAALLLRSITTP